ncbi:MAG: OmpA family protein [Bacteroidales bacterium]|nr:OmpA family protein [Bacteroidales bacterium]
MKRLNIFMGAAALAAVFMTATIKVNAQENGNRDEFGNIVRGPYETNRFGDNWFIGAGGGINIFLNEGYTGKIAPSLDVNFGKWFTPSIGMRVGYQGLNSKVEAGDLVQKFGYMYFHGDFLWNMSNALSGYKETRFWNFVPYLHAGYYRSYGIENIEGSNNELAAGAGLLHNLRLTDRLDLIIDMRATVVNGRVHGATGAALFPSVTMGLAVDLGWPNFERTSTIIGAIEIANAEKTVVLETAILALETANASLQNENKTLNKKNSDLKKQMNQMSTTVQKDNNLIEDLSPMTVYFEIGQTVLNDKELSHLDYYASRILKDMTENSKVEVTIMGSADSNTGTLNRNKQLSEARGKYIVNILTTKYGINPDCLILKSEVVKASAKPAMSRAAIISF